MASSARPPSRRPPRKPLPLSRPLDRLIPLGRLVGTHGLKGELRVKLFNPESSALANASEIVLLDHPEAPSGVGFRVVWSRGHGTVELLELEGIRSIEAAKAIVGKTVAARESDLEPLEEGQYYSRDLIGLSVVEEDGTELGSIREVIATGASDVLSVTGRGKEHLIPLVSDVVRSIDMATRKIVVRLPLVLDD